MKYDEQVLLKAADSLEQQARAIVIETAIRYGLITLLAAFAGGFLLQHFVHEFPVSVVTIVATLIAVLGGIAAGRGKAFALRLEAQKILVQSEIERNTRKPVS